MSQSRIIKVDRGVKKAFAIIKKDIDQATARRDALNEDKESHIVKYHADFKKVFVGKFFLIKDVSRDTKLDRYIAVKGVSAPYLIHNDSFVTCNLFCSVFDISKVAYEGSITTQIYFGDNEHYYAHTHMVEVTRRDFKLAFAGAIDFMNNKFLK